jgi:membrane associated rhomboid family serine protease
VSYVALVGAWVLRVNMLTIIGCVLCFCSTALTGKLGKHYNIIFLKYTFLSQLVASVAQALFPAVSTDVCSAFLL